MWEHSSEKLDAPQVKFDIPIFLSNAAAAFALNMSVFLLIGKTSALTMNIAGVIKDWMLIGLSVLIFKQVGRSIRILAFCSHTRYCWLRRLPCFNRLAIFLAGD